MLGEIIQKSILDWLQLTPELLSGRGKRALAARSTAVEPPAVDAAGGTEPSDIAAITLDSVQPSTSPMGFFTPQSITADPLPEPWQRSMADAYCPDDGHYASLESGGSQRAALAEMTGYLATRLAPAPAPPTVWAASPTDLGPLAGSIANAGG